MDSRLPHSRLFLFLHEPHIRHRQGVIFPVNQVLSKSPWQTGHLNEGVGVGHPGVSWASAQDLQGDLSQPAVSETRSLQSAWGHVLPLPLLHLVSQAGKQVVRGALAHASTAQPRTPLRTETPQRYDAALCLYL